LFASICVVLVFILEVYTAYEEVNLQRIYIRIEK